MDQIETVIKSNLPTLKGLPAFEYDLTLRIGKIQFTAARVIAKTVRENYLAAMFEVVLVTAMITPSQYAQLVLPGHTNIQATLVKRRPDGSNKRVTLHRAILADNNNPLLANNNAYSTRTSEMDMGNISVVTFQLISAIDYDIRLRRFEGINFKNAMPITVLQHLLAANRLVDEYDQSNTVAKINTESGYVGQKFDTIEIDEGMSILDLPSYLQNEYGIYNQDLGCYLKNRNWYIFAPYGVAKHGDDGNKIVVINAPANRWRGSEINYKVEGRTLTILATGEVTHEKSSDAEALNGGTGIRYADINSLHVAKTSDNPVSNPKDYVTEYASSNYEAGFNNAPVAKGGFVANPAIYASALARRGGDVVEVIWERGDITLLTPGAPVRFITQNGPNIKDLQGTLIGAEEHSNVPEGGITETKHVAMVKLTLFLKKV